MIIALSGFMGSGKSTVGRRLAELLPDFLFADLDEFIEEDAGMSISEIFGTKGEKAFREMESDALECLVMTRGCGGRDMILSLGGGTLMNGENAALVAGNCENFYLKASVETLVENLRGTGDERPLLKGEDLRAKVERLMKERSSVYEDAADHVIVTDGMDSDGIAMEIMRTAGLGRYGFRDS